MIAKEKITRINKLAKKAKRGTLTEAEATEQTVLRTEYLQAFRGSFIDQLHEVSVMDKTGTDITPEKLKTSKRARKAHLAKIPKKAENQTE